MYPTELRRFAGATLIPQPLTFHKPTRGGTGSALKLNLKFQFEFGEADGEEFLKRTRGGLFIDFAKQGAQNAGGHATFLWTDSKTLVTAKLGLPDLSGILVAHRCVRLNGKPVPLDLRMAPLDKDDDEAKKRKLMTASFLHKSKFGDKQDNSTIVSYQFTGNGGVFRVSKSRDRVGQVSMTLAEELRFMRYLELSLDTLLRLGAR